MRQEPNHPAIVFGEAICRKIKTIFYPDISWDMVLAKKIGKMLSQINRDALPFFPEQTKGEMLMKISHYDKVAFVELCDVINLNKEEDR